MNVMVLILLVIGQTEEIPVWEAIPTTESLGATQTRKFMKELASFVEQNHLRKDPNSEMRGMIYEYYDVKRRGEFDQWMQGESLDTMHDGAWFAVSLVNAYRATGDEYYRDILTRWVLPFYCKMLNHSDTLFLTERDDARPGTRTFDKEHRLQSGEKGFVPYWWDDGGSISLERRRDKNSLGSFSCTDRLVGQDNSKYFLKGYSHGSSNHLAQAVGLMLLESWLLLRDSKVDSDRSLVVELAQAAKHLQECRMRHHGHIPMCDAPVALVIPELKLLQHLPVISEKSIWLTTNHYRQTLIDFELGKRSSTPIFANEQLYRYYVGLVRNSGEISDPQAFRAIYDAYTEPMLFRHFCDDRTPPPGVHHFELYPIYYRDGRPEIYRSELKNSALGSRFGPQNMICAGLALQILQAKPNIWLERQQRHFPKSQLVEIHDPVPGTSKSPHWTKVRNGAVRIELSGRRDSLFLRVRGEVKEGEIQLFSRPNAQVHSATIRFQGPKTVTVVDDQGKPLFFRRFDTADHDGFLVYLPYTIHKDQKPWMNGIEHGVYSIRYENEAIDYYLASSKEQVKDWLTYDLGCGLKYWQTIFESKRYIPTSLGAGDTWDKYSDSGAYAHLLSAASQWTFILEGKADWQQQRIPKQIE